MDLNKLFKEIPLETRIKVLCEASFIDLITELGYREDKMWSDDEQEQLEKLMLGAKKMTNDIFETIQEWK